MRKFILIVLTCALLFQAAFGQQTANLVLFNGRIFTSNAAQPEAQAIAVGGERILAVGSSDEIRKLAGAKMRAIDLQGRTVTPGFNDAHAHFMPEPDGFRLQFKDMEPSWTEVAKAVKNAVQKVPKRTWIFGTIGGGAMVDVATANRFVLDQIAPDHPVFLETYFGHGQIVNFKAMRLFGISETETDRLGGQFEREGAATKRINGRIFEYAQWRQNRRFADFAVLSQDIFTAPVAELPKTSSVLTVVGGKIVHDARVLK